MLYLNVLYGVFNVNIIFERFHLPGDHFLGRASTEEPGAPPTPLTSCDLLVLGRGVQRGQNYKNEVLEDKMDIYKDIYIYLIN
jgi:hypothetical protein